MLLLAGRGAKFAAELRQQFKAGRSAKFAKQQQWMTTNYLLLALAAIFGIGKAIASKPHMTAISDGRVLVATRAAGQTLRLREVSLRETQGPSKLCLRS
jgi:hypothetical protein